MSGEERPKLPATTEPTDALGLPGLKGIDEAAGKALNPAAEEFGKEIVPLGKRTGQITNRVGTLLIRALEPLVYGLEKAGDWIEKAVTERLRDVPEGKIVPPNPRIAVLAMQALTYSMGDELIREMFANLLAADMNADKKGAAHPAFVELIKEMTPADARLLKNVQEREKVIFQIRLGMPQKFFDYATRYSFSIDGLSDEQIGTSVNNLERLGLLERREEFPVQEEFDKMEAEFFKQYEQAKEQFNNSTLKAFLGVPEGGQVQFCQPRVFRATDD